jgi:eukaryotic-like serine/threonine-protein kinase
MPQPDADRNLLLGILAQQMDFVTRDALFAAMNAWIVRKETSLGALLVERGDLAQSRRDLLEALVDEHVRAHCGDPARSLQALSSVGPVAEDLSKLADPDIQASVGHLRTSETVSMSADPEETDPEEDRLTESLGQPTSRNGRFRVVRPHARGGLGVVSVALDDELDREVAFKEIKGQYADDDGTRARFVLEAEITGKLEHPGIIPIYSLGHDPIGRPFYAMRFIRGDSLADAINRFHDSNGPYVEPARQSLQLRELLGRFLDVCDAMAYAHSRGVLHRDLKPGNVMLGPFGETLVVDWGLALPLERVPEGHESPQGTVKSTKTESAALPREQGVVIGTLAYMPPEQAEGAIDRLGPRSDVYGLGAILYELLTAKRPIEGTSREQILHRVGHGEIKPPRQVRPEIPAALEAICLKALALKPEDRYATTRALAADVKAWLADEPVSARRQPFAERARRWAKRNRTAVTAAVAALLVGLVGLGAVAAVQTKARSELDRKNADLEAQRRLAEENAAQAIAAVKKFGDVIANEPQLKNNEALKDLRKRLLNEPLAFFQALRDRLQADRDTRPESLARLAEACFELGELTNEIGNKEDALTAYREVLAIRRKLADANPTVTKLQRALAGSHHNIGILLRATGKPVEALKAHESALAIRRKLADANPDSPHFWSDLAATHNDVALLLSETGKSAEALNSHESALAIRRKLADANPTVNEFQSDLAASHNDVALLLSETGKSAEALNSHESALSIWRKLADANPTVNEFQSSLALGYNNIGKLLRATGKPAEALKSCESALSIWRKLADANPTVTRYQSDLAGSYNEIGILLKATGKPAEALKVFESALVIKEKLADANPTVTEFQFDLAVSHNNIGNLLRATGEPAEALRSHESALAIYQKLADANPTVTRLQRSLAASQYNIGNLLIATGKLSEAMNSHESARAIWQKLAERNPTVTEFQSDLSVSHNNIGNLLIATGRPAEALKAFESSLEIQRKMVRDHPESPDFASNLGVSLNNLAAMDLGTKRFGEACVRLREAIDWQRKALATNPANPNYRQLLSSHLTSLIEAARGLDDSKGVADAERELAQLRDSDPSMVVLDARLSAILRGDQQPSENRERLQLAQRAYDKALHAAAAKLWVDALDADPKLAEDRRVQTRYNAACAAALAGSGQAKDVPAPDDAARAKLRDQARAWLQAELAVWTKILESGPPQARPFIVQTLQHWQGDADLAGVRESKAMEALPETERQACRALWAGVDALLARAQDVAK